MGKGTGLREASETGSCVASPGRSEGTPSLVCHHNAQGPREDLAVLGTTLGPRLVPFSPPGHPRTMCLGQGLPDGIWEQVSRGLAEMHASEGWRWA